MRSLLLALLLAPVTSLAAETHRVTWDLTVGDRKVGTRTATVTFEDGAGASRMIEARTEVQTSSPVSLRWRQRLTVLGSDDPASFLSVVEHNGSRREIQGRWTGDAWRIVTVDRRGQRSADAAAWRIDLSTADLLDPGSSLRLAALTEAKVLSAETGEVWTGPVEALGPKVLTIAGQEVPVQGWAWTPPEGRSEFWYDGQGWLVRFETRVAGQLVAGQLTAPPPRSSDAFSIEIEPPKVEAVDL